MPALTCFVCSCGGSDGKASRSNWMTVERVGSCGKERIQINQCRSRLNSSFIFPFPPHPNLSACSSSFTALSRSHPSRPHTIYININYGEQKLPQSTSLVIVDAGEVAAAAAAAAVTMLVTSSASSVLWLARLTKVTECTCVHTSAIHLYMSSQDSLFT